MIQNNHEAESLFISGDAFETIARLYDVGNAVNMQGMAMRENVLYAFKVARDNSCQVLYRVCLDTGEAALCVDSSTGEKMTDYLTHANDACLFERNGELHMLVATMAQDKTALMELKVDKERFWPLRGYGLDLPGRGLIRTSAVEILSQDAAGLTLLLNDRNDCYYASLSFEAASDTLRLSPAFRLIGTIVVAMPAGLESV